jgi:hypothetical protein
MLFWIFAIMLIVGIALYWNSSIWDTRHCIGWCMAAVGAVCVIVAGLILFFSYIEVGAQEGALKTRQEAIEYKINSGVYRDEFNLLDKDTVAEVAYWNSDLIKYKALQRNFWIGIFIPNIYDDLEIIDYERIK